MKFEQTQFWTKRHVCFPISLNLSLVLRYICWREVCLNFFKFFLTLIYFCWICSIYGIFSLFMWPSSFPAVFTLDSSLISLFSPKQMKQEYKITDDIKNTEDIKKKRLRKHPSKHKFHCWHPVFQLHFHQTGLTGYFTTRLQASLLCFFVFPTIFLFSMPKAVIVLCVRVSSSFSLLVFNIYTWTTKKVGFWSECYLKNTCCISRLMSMLSAEGTYMTQEFYK